MEAKKTFSPPKHNYADTIERLDRTVNEAIQKAISGGWPSQSIEALAVCDGCADIVYRRKGAGMHEWEHNDTRLTERLHKAEPYGPSILTLEEWEQRCRGCDKSNDDCECAEPGTEIHLFEAQGRFSRRLLIQPNEHWHTGLGVAPEYGFIRVMRIDPAHRGQPWVEDMDKFLCPWLFKETYGDPDEEENGDPVCVECGKHIDPGNVYLCGGADPVCPDCAGKDDMPEDEDEPGGNPDTCGHCTPDPSKKKEEPPEKKVFRVYVNIRGDASIDCLAHDVEEACAYVERRLAEEGVTEFINAEDVEVYNWHTNVDRENSELNDYSG